MKLVAGIFVAFVATFAVGEAGSSNLRQSFPEAASLVGYENDKCTTIVVGPKAGIEGPMTTHTADCADCDFRMGKVPARDWPAGTQRPLYQYKDQYPVIISANRGNTWDPENLQGNVEQLSAWGKESAITAYIPQVAHTYALLEGGYAIMNEHQVAIGESTCAARFWGVPVTAGGLAKIEVAEMSKIALERSTTARQAIQMMGDLATELGFYAADWSGGDRSSGEAGEALTVIDKTEAWVFHVLGDDTGASAVWAAQRLEPDHVAVVANSFIIRNIDEHSENFMYSANIFEVAERNKLWSRASGKPLDFLPTFAPTRSHPEYSTRRVWRVLSQVAPSLNLPGETDGYGNDYPFSVKTERVLTPADLIAFNSDHYEGTPYDLTQGLAAGPYGDPNRFDGSFTNNMTVVELLSGGYERAISMFRTSYSFVAQARPAVPDSLALIWFSQYNPASSSYAPFYVAMEKPPAAYTRGSLGQGCDSSVAYWNFLAVGNYAGRFYRYAMVDVRAVIARVHTQLVQDTAAFEKTVLKQIAASKGASAEVVKALTEYTSAKSEYIQTEWRALLPHLITKFHDGMIATALDQPSIVMRKLFYPKWWLEATGYFLHKGNFGPGVILFEPTPETATSSAALSYTATMVLVAVCSSLVTVLGVMYVLHRQNKRHEYAPIPSANV